MTWPPEIKLPKGGRWVPYGPWRFNRDDRKWQRTYDYIVIGTIYVTTQRVKHLNGKDSE